jgi:hypothetical protein
MTPAAQMAGPVDASHGISKPPHFLVGRDRSGQWVVCDQNGRCGGVFATRAQAFRFACQERGDGPGAVVLVPGVLELSEAPTDHVRARSPNDAGAVIEQVPLEV